MTDAPTQSGQAQFSCKVHWASVRRGAQVFVQERVPGKHMLEFGPLCPLLVEAFVEERKAYYRALASVGILPNQVGVARPRPDAKHA